MVEAFGWNGKLLSNKEKVISKLASSWRALTRMICRSTTGTAFEISSDDALSTERDSGWRTGGIRSDFESAGQSACRGTARSSCTSSSHHIALLWTDSDMRSELSPQTPIPSTLLLNTLLRTRPSKISNTASSSILNSGNCLAVLNLDSSGTRRKERNTSAAFWRIGDDSGRPNAVGMGVFEEQHPDDMLVKLSRFDKFGRFDDLPPFKINHRKPICSTPAPILQIQATPLISSNLLAIRTATSIAFHRTRGIDDIVRQAAAPVYEFTGREMNRRSIADMVLGGIDGGDAGSGLVVDVEGGLFGFGLGTAGSMAYISRTGAPQKPTMYVLRRGRRKENYSGFAKVVWGGSRGLDAVVGLEDEVLVFDLRASHFAMLS